MKKPRNSPSESKPRISALEKSRKRAKQNLETGELLGAIAESCHDTSAQVTADLLKLSAYDKASGELTNLIDKKGRAFTCPQSLISANTLLDANYQIKTARRHRKVIYNAFASRLDDIKEFGLNVSFLTPTFPNLLGVGFNDNDKFQTRAWEMFLQMKAFGDFFYGGYSKTEWTEGGKGERAKTGRAFDLDLDGINYHFHILAINYKPFAEGETSQLENKLAYMNNDAKYGADDKRQIRNSLRIVSAWTECLKKAHLEIFGTCLKVKTNSRRVRFTFQNVGLDEIKTFDLEESRNGIFWEIAKTASYTAKGTSFSKLPPELLLEAENVFKNKRIINPFGAFRKYVQKKSKPSESLVNQPTKQSEKMPHNSDNSLFDNVLRGKNEPLKTYGTRLCEQGLRDTWLRYLEVNVGLIIAKRRDALLERFPNSVFTDLSGKSYYGWRAVKELKQREKEKQPGYDPESDNYHRFKVYQAQYLDAVPVDVCNPERVTPIRQNDSPQSYKTAPPAQIERIASWELFDSFCGLGSENQQARIV
jgi:hypothetical protein